MGMGQEDRQETGQAYLVEPQAAPAEEHQEGHHAPHGEQVQAGVGGSPGPPRPRGAGRRRRRGNGF